MSPIFSFEQCTLGIKVGTETYYIGPPEGNSSEICILPEGINPPPIFTLNNVDKDDVYTISIGGQSIETADDKLYLGEIAAAPSEKWKFVPSGDTGYMIRGNSGRGPCWSTQSSPPLPQSDSLRIAVHKRPDTFRYSMDEPCGMNECHRSSSPVFANCSGFPSPCATIVITQQSV